MAVVPLLVSTYARNIYRTGTTRFSNISEPYHDPVKLYAAQNYFIDDIDAANVKGWITAAEHDDTIALKTENDPQYRE